MKDLNNNASTKVFNSQRLLELDWIKFVALGLMVFTHVCMYFYDFSSTIGNFFSDLGGTVCFTLFLAAYGATLPALVERYETAALIKKLLKRAAEFYILYIIVGILFSGISSLPNLAVVRISPVFANFLIAFTTFFLVSILLVKLIKENQFRLLALISLCFYLSSQFLFLINVDGMFAPYKAILVGQSGFEFFPIFQYLIILVIGILIGKFSNKILQPKALISLLAAGLGLSLCLQFISLNFSTQLSNLALFERWQVTPLFLLTGINFLFFLLLLWNILSKILNKLPIFNIFTEFVISTSKQTQQITILHLLFVFLLWQIELERQDLNTVLTLYLAVMLVSAFNYKSKQFKNK